MRLAELGEHIGQVAGENSGHADSEDALLAAIGDVLVLVAETKTAGRALLSAIRGEAQDEVVIRTSSVLFVKTGGLLAAWVLTEQEIRILNDNPHLMRSPLELLDALPRLRPATSGPLGTDSEDARTDLADNVSAERADRDQLPAAPHPSRRRGGR
jgi:hypothetical protein